MTMHFFPTLAQGLLTVAPFLLWVWAELRNAKLKNRIAELETRASLDTDHE